MENQLSYKTIGLIYRVNKLIERVNYFLDNYPKTDERGFIKLKDVISYNILNIKEDSILSDLLLLEEWGATLRAYIESGNNIEMIDSIDETPLYKLLGLQSIVLSDELTFAIENFCVDMAAIRELQQNHKTMKVTAKAGRPRKIEKPFVDYVNSPNSEKRAEIINAIQTLINNATLKKHQSLVIRAAVELGLISKPTVKVVNSTFAKDIRESTYNYAFSEYPDEIIFKGYREQLSKCL